MRSPWNSERGLAPREEVEEGELELELMFPATSASSSPSDNSATERTGGVYRSLPLPPLDRDGRDKPAKSSTGTGDLSFPLLPLSRLPSSKNSTETLLKLVYIFLYLFFPPSFLLLSSFQVLRSEKPFHRMENITHFLLACRKYEVRDEELFTTSDLFHKREQRNVVAAIHALSRRVQVRGANRLFRRVNRLFRCFGHPRA